MLAIGVAVAASAFLLLLFLASLGDSDLPPYDPTFPGERAGWLLCELMSWPLVLAAFILGRDPPFVLWLPLMFFGGLSWAALIEAVVLIRRTRKA
jgi:hypothetical protein